MKYNNECYDALINIIEKNPNSWKDILKQKPYSLKAIKTCFYNPSWVMLVYNLFESDLLNPVVRACRGTVIDISDITNVKIVCSPYLKFCNLGEFPEEDKKLNWKTSWVSEKIDGILIKASKIDGVMYWFTNGSFDLSAPLMDCSEKYIEKETDNCKNFCDLIKYAIKKIGSCAICDFGLEGSEEIGLKTNGGWCDNFPDGFTLCFELTSPKNRIICDYSETELWLHGVSKIEEGKYAQFTAQDIVASSQIDDNLVPMNVKTPRIFDLQNPSPETIKNITDMFDGSEEEGVVVCDDKWHRVKIKSKSYLEHKFKREINNISDKKLFSLIATEQIDDFVNDNNRNKIKNMLEKVNDFKNNYNYFKHCLENDYNNKYHNSRAELAKDNSMNKLKHLAFKAIDGKEPDDIFEINFGNGNGYKKFLLWSELLSDYVNRL